MQTFTKNIKWVIVMLMSFSLAFFLFGKNLNAKFGIIDDHEIIAFLGVDKKIGFSEFPSLLGQTEVARYGTSSRYRPTYYLLRLVEAKLWGDHPELWYGVRLVSLALAIAICWYLIAKLSDDVTATFFIFYTLSHAYWSDIFNRLGPGETYAVLGLASYCLGYYAIMIRQVHHRLIYYFSWIMFMIGLVVCVGVKENFLFLLIPTLYVAGKFVREKRILESILATLASGYTTWIAWGMILGLRHTRVDVYGGRIDVVGRIITLVGDIKGNTYIGMFLIITVLLGVVIYYLWRRFGTISRILLMKQYWIYLVGCLLLLLSQVIFYDSKLPAGNRYDYPFILVFDFSILFVYLYAKQFLYILKLKQIARILSLALLVFFTYFIVRSGYIKVRSGAQRNVEKTNIFDVQIKKVIAKTLANPESQLLFVVSNPKYYEQVASVHRYLYYLNIKSPMYLWYREEEIDQKLNKSLSALLTRVTEDGSTGDKWGFNPRSKYDKNQNCFSLIFGESSGPSECVDLTNF